MSKVIILFLFSFAAYAGNENYGNVSVSEVTSIYDADTFRANIAGWHDIIGKCVSIRVNGVDAPEIRGKCQSEKDVQNGFSLHVNYFDRYVKTADEAPTIGMVLCHRKNDAVVELTLPEESNIYASRYQLYLHSKEELKAELQKIESELNDF